MTTSPDEPDFEDYLTGSSRVSSEYRSAAREQTPAALDARILAEAAAAVKQADKRPRPQFWWLRPVALAATVLVSLSLVLRLGELPVPAPRQTRESDADTVTVQMIAPEAKAVESRPPPPPAANFAVAAQAKLQPPATVMTPDETTAVKTAARKEVVQEAPLAITAFESEQRPSSGITAEAPAPAVSGAIEARVNQPSASASPDARTTMTVSPAALERAIAAIRLRIAPRIDAVASERSKYKEVPANTDERLRKILALHEQGRADETAAALADFARDFPADPVSVLLKEP